MMTHNILAIADASRDALSSILNALRVIRKDSLSLRIILLSFLSVLSEKDCKLLGPNTLFLLVQDEKEVEASLREYLTKMNIHCSLRFITSPVWEGIFEEMGDGDQDLIILQGRFLKIWEERTEGTELLTHAGYRPKCSMMAVNQQEERSLC
jgi:hypothetical protein